MAKVAKIASKPTLIQGENLRLDLACGDNKRSDGTWVGIDKYKTNSTDYVFDLLEFPWPIADDSCEMLSCSHFFEHIPALARPKFMEECYRILKPGAQLIIVVPHYNSVRAVQDFTHTFPPVSESSFLYMNKGWREQNKLTHGLYDIACDFDFSYGYSLDPDVQVRNSEFQQFAIKHYTNSAMDLHVTMTKRG